MFTCREVARKSFFRRINSLNKTPNRKLRIKKAMDWWDLDLNSHFGIMNKSSLPLRGSASSRYTWWSLRSFSGQITWEHCHFTKNSLSQIKQEVMQAIRGWPGLEPRHLAPAAKHGATCDQGLPAFSPGHLYWRPARGRDHSHLPRQPFLSRVSFPSLTVSCTGDGSIS